MTVIGFELTNFLAAAAIVFGFISAILYFVRPEKPIAKSVWSPPEITLLGTSWTSDFRAKAELDGKIYYLRTDNRWYDKATGLPTTERLRQTLWSWYNATLTHKAAEDLKKSMEDLP
jgi:hypothetical protein